MQSNTLKGLAKFPYHQQVASERASGVKTLPNLVCGCFKTSAVATPEWEQPKEEEEVDATCTTIAV